jgi:adenine-specific DNA methylase
MGSPGRQKSGHKPSKYAGRTVKSEVNRIGQAWREEPEYKEQDDKSVVVIFHHFKCKEEGCGAVVEIEENDWAACTKCGRIYNDFVADQAHEARLELNREISWSRFVKKIKEP